jgi:hypothetical protein
MQFGHPTQDFLTSIGFHFSQPASLPGLPEGITYSQLLEKHHRIQCRQKVGEAAFGPILEGVIAQLLLGTFKYDAVQGIKIEDEGTGGDYDVLAFTPPHLIYVECKSGNTLGFKNIIARHELLKPALTLIVHDVSKVVLESNSLKEAQKELTKQAIANQPSLASIPTYIYPVTKISPEGRSYVLYHMTRNVFLTSGEDLEHAVRMTLRHFHQVVEQSSYW